MWKPWRTSAAQPFRCRATFCRSLLIRARPPSPRLHRHPLEQNEKPKTSNESSEIIEGPDQEALPQRDGLRRSALRLFHVLSRAAAENPRRSVGADRRHAKEDRQFQIGSR